ncbi:MAG: DNA polymerase III subunit beta [Solitalea-like symbiont of Acarus siro]
MKFCISSENLLKYISGIEKAVSKNNSLPILDNFHLRIKDNTLNRSANDLVVFASVVIPEIEIKGDETEIEVLMNSSILIDTLRRLPKQEIIFSIETNEDTASTEIAAIQGKYKIPSKPANGYPNIPVEKDPDQIIQIESKIFKSAISKTEFAISNNDAKAALTGLYFKLISGTGFDFVATDAHKLVRYTVFNTTIDRNEGFIIPKKTLSLLESVYKTNLCNTDYLLLCQLKNYCIIELGPYKLACRLIDDVFPNYEAIVPKNNHNKLIIDRKELFEALRRIELYANHATYQAKFNISANTLTLSSEDIDFNSHATESLNCTYTGDDLEIGFNAKYLIEILDKRDSREVNIELSQPNKAGLITPVYNIDEEENTTKLIMLLMPVTLSH